MSPRGTKLTRSFYLRPTLTVAEDLLRASIVYHHPTGTLSARIVEVEAYIGEGDPACHAAVGRTQRNDIMYERGGFSYIYFIYGMYHCFNIVTEKKGFPAAVLVRAVEPEAGEEIMAANSPSRTRLLTDGPGKFCRAFGLDRRHNGLDLTGSELYLVSRSGYVPEVGRSPRIGIRKGTDKLWRFFDRRSRYISRNTYHVKDR